MILIIKHARIEGPGEFSLFFQDTDWKIGIIELEEKDTFPSLNECEAIISLGGPMNVYETDKYRFLTEEEDFLKRALQKEIPILGICLGAQLLAKISGAKVSKAEQREIGWYRVNLTPEGKSDPLFKGLDGFLDVFQWHEDTFEIPPAGLLLATSATCRNQALRVKGKPAWGLQFHPEMTPEMLGDWLNDDRVNLNKDKLLLEYFRIKDRYLKQLKVISLNFARAITNSLNPKQ